MQAARPSQAYLCAILLAVLLVGCSKQDGRVILGQWHAERFDVMGLKLPIGPDLTISPDTLAVEEGGVPIRGIERDGDEVVLDIPGNIGLTFHMVDANRMYVQVPFIDRIYYRRVKPQGASAELASAGHRSTSGVPAARQPAAVAAPRAASAPAYMAVYEAAVLAARQGENDVALRHLHEAVQQGFANTNRLQNETAFAELRADPRYQVIMLNMQKP